MEECESVEDVHLVGRRINGPDCRRRRNMPYDAEPTGDPSRKGSMLRLGNHGRPEIWTAIDRICAANLWNRELQMQHNEGHAEHTPAIAKPTSIVKKAVDNL